MKRGGLPPCRVAQTKKRKGDNSFLLVRDYCPLFLGGYCLWVEFAILGTLFSIFLTKGAGFWLSGNNQIYAFHN